MTTTTSSAAARSTPRRANQRVDPGEFSSLTLRAHELLSDVPLHDAWRIRLRGRGDPPDMQEVIDFFVTLEKDEINRVARLLFAIRKKVGKVLGWDREDPSATKKSYVHRLTPEDRSRSLDEPGSRRGFWTCVYTHETEALGEVINRTVHAFLLFAIRPGPDGYTLYWGIYVKAVNRFTHLYMTMIDPFRRRLIYPMLIRRVETRWLESTALTRRAPTRLDTDDVS